jgi:hypothetical protein
MKSIFWGKYLLAVLATGCHASAAPDENTHTAAVATPPVSAQAEATPATLAYGSAAIPNDPRARPEAIPLPASRLAQPMTPPIKVALLVYPVWNGHDEAVMVTRIMQYDKFQPGQGVVLSKLGIPAPATLAANVVRDPVCGMAITGKAATTCSMPGPG